MNYNEAAKFMRKEIDSLEKSVFMFDEVIKPRAEADRQILYKLRAQEVKLQALITRLKAGEQPSVDEFNECVPASFRVGK
jgi:uncharacterized coiled-coil DUF342 family protein